MKLSRPISSPRQVAAADLDPVGVGLADLGGRLPGLADRHRTGTYRRRCVSSRPAARRAGRRSPTSRAGALVLLRGHPAALLEVHLGPPVAEVGELDDEEVDLVLVGAVGDREHESLGLDDLGTRPPSGSSAAAGRRTCRPPGAARPDVHRQAVERDLAVGAAEPVGERRGSVHSRHTRSRGASKTRVIAIPWRPIGFGCSAIRGRILARLPASSSRRSSPPRSRGRSPSQSAASRSGAPRSRDGRSWAVRPRSMRPACSSTRRCLRDGLEADRERRCELVDRRLARRSAAEDRPPGGVGKGGEGGAELVGRHLYSPACCTTD